MFKEKSGNRYQKERCSTGSSPKGSSLSAVLTNQPREVAVPPTWGAEKSITKLKQPHIPYVSGGFLWLW
jgi:hypothetical protein